MATSPRSTSRISALPAPPFRRGAIVSSFKAALDPFLGRPTVGWPARFEASSHTALSITRVVASTAACSSVGRDSIIFLRNHDASRTSW